MQFIADKIVIACRGISTLHILEPPPAFVFVQGLHSGEQGQPHSPDIRGEEAGRGISTLHILEPPCSGAAYW